MRLILFVLGLSLIGCAQFKNTQDVSEWDFDHQVRFEQTKLNDTSYSIKVLRHNDTHFAQLATFIVRHAYQLCQGYGYSIEILDGVETYDDKQARPNWIPPSLSANVECVKN
ncbi:hypothetical protein [Thalassotalea piscium]|uniref:Lipoprotein n=1 Tax=Thalassotalea piscium TaxID=1230533 RepID=A0A7X0TRX9_9GAMM|nr:hypothetical protein [Thalassotalea piscium]MBB6541529.1 hypothetical protein [Thalassotalea piscium]